MQVQVPTSMGGVAVRPTSEADAAALRELRLEALWMHPEAFASDHAESAQRPLQWWVERARDGSGEKDQLTVVAEAPTGELVGMCGLYREQGGKVRHNAHVWGVYVRPAWRGLKIADAMLDLIECWASQRGIRVVRLTVSTTNDAAIRCYERRRYQIYGTSPEAICSDGRFIDEILMSKQLEDGGMNTSLPESDM